MYYDYQINAFLFCEDINRYGTIHKAPEFLFTLSSFNEKTVGMDEQWENITKPHVVKFKTKLKNIAFYDCEEEYIFDSQNNWMELRKRLLSRAIESSFSNLESEKVVYMKPEIFISPDDILEYIQAEKWRKDVLKYFGKIEMYQSVAEIIGTDIDIVRKYILQSMGDIIDWNYDEHSIDKMNIAGLIKECGCKKLKRIDSLTVSHITPRENIDSVWKDGFMTLPHVLTKKTMLSDYLQKLGFEFSFDDNKIIMKRDGEIVDIEKLDFSNLKMRLGGEKTLNDFNVNGYLFIDEFELFAVRGWLGSPEILKSLANSYRKNSIADNYADRCINYYVSFVVPIEKVDIEGFPDWLDEDSKTEILFKYTINALAYEENKRKHYFPMYNPIIMLKRNYDVPGSDIRKVWRLDLKGSKFVPVDDI